MRKSAIFTIKFTIIKLRIFHYISASMKNKIIHHIFQNAIKKWQDIGKYFKN